MSEPGAVSYTHLVIFAIYFGDFTGVVLLAAGTLHDVRVLQTCLLSRCHADVFLWGIFHEIVALHPEFADEFDDVVAFFGMLGVVDGFHLFHLSLRHIWPASLKYRNEEELLAEQDDPQKYNDEVLFPDKRCV